MKCTFFGTYELYDKDFPRTVREALRTFVEHHDNAEFLLYSARKPGLVFLDAVTEIRNTCPHRHITVTDMTPLFLPGDTMDAERANKRLERNVVRQCDTVFMYYYTAVAYSRHRLAERIRHDPTKTTVPLTSAETEQIIAGGFSVLTDREAVVMELTVSGLNMSEIARQIHCTPSAVRQKRVSGSRKLRNYMRNLGRIV